MQRSWIRTMLRSWSSASSKVYRQLRKARLTYLLLPSASCFTRRTSRPSAPTKTKAEGLVGRQVLAVINFKPRQVGKYISEVLFSACLQRKEVQHWWFPKWKRF
jgi:hypothetical protein